MNSKTNCPSKDQLQRFDEGRLDDSEIEDIAEHLSQCADCLAQMEHLDPNAMMEGFRLALAKPPITIDEPDQESISEQVDSILETIRPSDSQDSDRQFGSELFKLGKLLGSGDFCETYHAVDSMVGARYLVKLPHTHLVSSLDHCSQFLADARKASRLQSEFIVNVENCGMWDNKRPYFATNFHEMATLQEWIKKVDELDFEQFVFIVVQIYMAISTAHKARVMHRHLSPSSIYLNDKHQVFVADFGVTYDGHYQFELVEPIETPTRFHSPEAVRNNHHRIDLRTDIWSFGAIIEWLLESTVGAVQSVADELRSLAKDCQRKSRRKRIQTIGEVQERLRMILDRE